MLAELILSLALKAIGLFITRAEERKAWERAIRQRLTEIDGRSQNAAQLSREYDRLQAELRTPSNEQPTRPNS